MDLDWFIAYFMVPGYLLALGFAFFSALFVLVTHVIAYPFGVLSVSFIITGVLTLVLAWISRG